MKRRTKGTGTIVKVGNVYYGRIVIKGKVRKVKLSSNQRESEVQWREWLAKNPVQVTHDESARHSIQEAWTAFEDRLISKSTSKDVKAYYRNYFNSFAAYMVKNGKNNLEDVTSVDIVKYLDEVTAGLSNVTKRNHLYMIKGLFETNLPDIVPPTKNVKLKPETSTPRQPLTNAEIETILASAEKHVHGQQFKALIMVALYTGLRRKDCVYLKREEVRDDVIMVTPRKTQGHGVLVRIPLNSKLKDALESLGVSSGYFFPDLVKLYEAGNIRCHLETIFSAIGEITTTVQGRKRKVPLKGFHALRATFITKMAEKGVSLPIMESLAGHLNPQQTMHYTHPSEDVKKAAIDTISFSSSDAESVFVHPEVRKVLDACKRQIEETIEKALGRHIEVAIVPKQDILGGEENFFNL
jgi:integrase/recombinase XerD